MQAQRGYMAGTRKTLLRQFQRLIDDAQINLSQFVRQRATAGDEVTRILAESLDTERGTVLKALEPADGMNPSDEPPHPLTHIRTIELSRAPSLPRKNGETQILVRVECLSIQHLRSNNGQFPLGKLARKVMFFANCGVRPASEAIKLGDTDPTIVERDLIDTILVAIECQQAAIRPQTNTFKRIKEAIRR